MREALDLEGALVNDLTIRVPGAFTYAAQVHLGHLERDDQAQLLDLVGHLTSERIRIEGLRNRKAVDRDKALKDLRRELGGAARPAPQRSAFGRPTRPARSR